MPLMRFIDLNLDINNIHEYPRRDSEIPSPVLFGFESMKGLGHTHKYSTSFTHSFQPHFLTLSMQPGQELAHLVPTMAL